ncbi:MAG TPA: radical SAM protein [Candidatus Lokiarchaeia archaeon]|nr:radical SAM protein [Candidatus Lokiarchaeia archaeon]
MIRPEINIGISTDVNPPIGLGYLAACLEQQGFTVTVLDLALRRLSNDDLIRFIKKRDPLMVGITALTSYYGNMKLLARLFKSKCQDIPIVLGGVHVSSLPLESMKECLPDFLVIGEGEETIVELASALRLGKADYEKIAGIAFWKNGEIIITKERQLIENLDGLPLPAWNKINPNKYPKLPHGFIMVHKEIAPILSSRGCPYSCSYCASCRFWHQRIRFRSPVKVVDEIEFLYKKYGIREFSFWDDNLTLNRSHIQEICKEILKRHITALFSTPNGVRVDTLDEPMLRLMHQAGFYYLTFAVESGSIKVLHDNQKYTSLKKIAQTTIIAKKLGYEMNSFFIIGFENETAEDIKKTIKFAKALPYNMKTFFVLKPLPGSPLFERWSSSLDLTDFDWGQTNYWDNKMSVNKLGPRITKKWRRKAYMETVVRFPEFFHYLFYRFIKRGHWYQLGFLIKRVIYILAGSE